MSLSGNFRISQKESAHRVPIILLFAALTAALAARMARADDAPQIIAGPYLQSPSENSMTVMWLTNRNATSWVEYGETEALSAKAIRARDGLVDADTRIHRVALTNLKPGAKYFCGVFSKEVAKFDPYKITYGATVSAGPFSFTTFARAKTSATTSAFLAYTSVVTTSFSGFFGVFRNRLFRLSGEEAKDSVTLLSKSA